MSIKNLSVFFPCFNEEGNLENTVRKAVDVLRKLGLDYEIIIVNDGSKDKTGLIAEGLARENTRIRVIHHLKNLGYGEALKSGFYNSNFGTIAYTDGDGQFDFSEVTKFIDKISQADLVIGYRIRRRDPFFRLLFAKGWALSLLAFFRLNLRDADCGFKMVKREVLEKIPRLESQRGAMINAELAIKTQKAGFKVAQVGVTHYPRLSGKPTGANIKVIIKSYLDLIRLWWQVKQRKALFVTLVLIISMAAFLRFYRLSEYMTFLGDEGRDALVIKSMLLDYHMPLIGPPTSVGNIYLGPLYYYMMAIPMSIFWLDPVAAAGMNAAIGVLTVFLIYLISKRFFGKEAGLIASFLYALSPVTITYSRSSWNPNPAPFFALLGIYSLYNAFLNKGLKWFVFSGAFIAAAVQMHYLALILIPVAAMIWLAEVLRYGKQLKFAAKSMVFGALGFIFVSSPLVIFDFRHNFLNYRALLKLFASNESVGGDLFANLAKIPDIFFNTLIGRYITLENIYLSIPVSILVLIPFFLKRSRPVLYLAVWLGIGILGLSFYQQNIYDHYLGFMNPAPFILIGSVFVLIRPVKNFLIKKAATYGFIIFLLVLGTMSLQGNPLLSPPNNQLKRTETVAKYVIEKSGNRDFNFALLAKNNYDAAYQFYLDKFGHPAKQVPFDITGQLFVVCEDTVCEPINNQKYEIAGFGWAKVVFETQVSGVKIFKLIRNPTGKP